ncbi:MAG: hypothetical protein A3H98_02405 [Bacteroidetes bacterium RIFCSPLOWO2_02_FULL_36_8]|nr:MAG: hypothetical protein A3H98_02405 [Bacteroidetes bacterium RIFCSPLOWO2_02_FULL_36_8]OFY70970.1 MAG: hypothetical protein A3G23_12710 [Bacteroidetes bacterium RIFCSPLOWO2_12_FULL_37_12]
MRNYSIIFLLCILFSPNLPTFSNADTIDSLFSRLKISRIDTEKADILNTIGSSFRFKNPDTSILLGKQALALALKARWLIGLGNIYSNLGIFYRLKGNYDSALFFQFQSLKIYEQLFDNSGIAAATGNIGVIYIEQGNMTKGLNYFQKALKISKEIGDKQKMARFQGNIGAVLVKQGNYPKALDYYFQALKISVVLKDNDLIASIYSNIGNVYTMQENLPLALNYYSKSLELVEKTGNNYGIAIILNNMGENYVSQGKLTMALNYFLKALKISEEMGNQYSATTLLGSIGLVFVFQGDSAVKAGNNHYAMTVKYPLALEYLNKGLKIAEEIGHKESISYKYGNIGLVYLNQKELEKAEEFCLKSLSIAKEIGSKDLCKDNFQHLAEIFKIKGEKNLNNLNGGNYYKQAFENYQNYILYRDSIYNKDNEKKQARLETQYEYEKAEIIKKSVEAESLRISMEEKTRRNILQYSGIAIAFVILFTAIILLVRIHVGRKLIEAIIFISILLWFEFIIVLIDPYVEQWTGGAPVWKLIFNAGVAILIYPFHSWVEKIVLKKILRRK